MPFPTQVTLILCLFCRCSHISTHPFLGFIPSVALPEDTPAQFLPGHLGSLFLPFISVLCSSCQGRAGTGAGADTSELAQVELAAVWEAESLPEVAVMISVLIHLPSCSTGATLAEDYSRKAPQPPTAALSATWAWPSYASHEEGFSSILGCHVLNSLSRKKNILSEAFG